MKKRIKKAFTLVELLVVIAILAVLSTVAIVGYNSFTEKAEISSDQQTVTQMNTVIDAVLASGDDLNSGEDAYAAIMENGYDGNFKTAYGAYSIAWLAEEKAIVLVTMEAVAFPEKYAGLSLDKVSPLYTVTPTNENELKDAFKGKCSNYVNINIPTTGLEVASILELNENVTAVINLEGSISSASPSGDRMRNFGKLTVNGNGNQMITLVNNAGASLEVNNTILGYEGSGLQSIMNNGGKVVLNNVTFINDSVDNGVTYAYVVINNFGTTIINDGKYSGNTHGIFGVNGGKVIVNGGEYILGENSTAHVFYNEGGLIEVNNGTFTQNNSNNYMIYAKNSGDLPAKEVVTLNGGTYTGGKYSFNEKAVTLDDFKK